MKKMLIALICWFLCLTAAIAAANTAQKSSSQTSNEHALFQRFLDRYVSVTPDHYTIVHYSKVTAEDKKLLASYIDYLATHVPKNNCDDELAYWINLYNALTIKLILDNFPVTSIKDIKSSWLFNFLYPGPWYKKLIKINSESFSLNDIEHEIIRKRWQDNRIHYALNCASVGCPKLQTKVFQGASINRQLDQAAKEYINSAQGVSFENGQLIVSEIYHWYASDFGTTEQSILDHLKHYASPDLKDQLNKNSHISGYKYDWSLNGD